MAGELEGKVAIVTGGASGIGKATVELFVAEGAKVVIADMNREAGEALSGEIGEAARFFAVDVSQRAEVEALVGFAVAEFGKLDVMFNNAGISCAAFPDFLDDTLEDFDKVVAVNLLGVDAGAFWQQIQNTMAPADVYEGIIKSFVFGVAASLFAVWEGYNAIPTAEGVGRATTRTVVITAITVLILDFMITAIAM